MADIEAEVEVEAEDIVIETPKERDRVLDLRQEKGVIVTSAGQGKHFETSLLKDASFMNIFS